MNATELKILKVAARILANTSESQGALRVGDELECLIENAQVKEPDLFLEELADFCHQQWSNWVKYMFSRGEFVGRHWTMEAWATSRWTRQMNTSYKDLSSSEQVSDYIEARKFLEALSQGVNQ